MRRFFMTRDPTISPGLACSLFERLSTKATFDGAGSAIAIPEAAAFVWQVKTYPQHEK